MPSHRIEPRYALAHQWYASYLNAMGRLEEAQAELRRARELDPLSLMLNMSAADPYFFGREYRRAIKHLLATLEHDQRFFPAIFNLGRAYVQEKMYEEAIAALERAVRLSGNREGLPALAHAYALAGREDDARKILKQLREKGAGRYVASPLIARIHLGLGEIDAAFEWLRKGLDERSYWNVFLKMDPVYDPIRPDPRFAEMLKRIGLLQQSRSAA
ncbi:MAG TPA: tetratricopeptide repeat protein [Candidatus Acidoferrum sp.]|nr:tetratricopeptide repeat protein [Candidatus Acidoferrum sp.]